MNDEVVVFGYLKEPTDDTERIAYHIPLDGGVFKEIGFKTSDPSKNILGGFFFDIGDSPRLLAQVWEKETGSVTIYMQALNKENLQPVGPYAEVGVVSLDPKSYNGQYLSFENYLSPDKTKRLIYFDGVQSSRIKLAMCWVLDMNDQLLWHGTYRIPVQAYGAETSVTFTNSGQVLVEVMAVVLDENNTVSKADGNIDIKMNRKVAEDMTASAYMMHGEDFLHWDGKLSGDLVATRCKIAQTPAGVMIFASTRKGTKKSAEYGWFLGDIVDGFRTQHVSSGPLEEPFFEIHHDQVTGFHGIGGDAAEKLVVTRIEHDGTLAWQHSAPLVQEAFRGEFKMVAGALTYLKVFSAKGIRSLNEGQRAKIDVNGHYLLPTVISWKNGKRVITPLCPVTAKSKEIPSLIQRMSLFERGLVVRAAGQRAPNLTFIPISWD